MLQTVQNELAQRLGGLQQPKLLLACSGGVDSMVLLHLLQQLNYSFGVAHVNFMLRSDDSNEDEKFIERYCTLHRLPFYSRSFQTDQWAAKNNLSIQMAARDLRYTWFNSLKEKHDYTHVLTAHHLDDQVETLLINLGRGSGLKGMQGISSAVYLRPLLSFSKDEIINYAKENELMWRDDSTNAKTDYLRNFLRHELITPWKKAHPPLLNNIKKSLDYLALAQEALAVQVQNFKKDHFIDSNGKTTISLLALNNLNPLEYYLHALFSTYGFSHLSDLKSLLIAQSGKFLVSDTHRLFKDRDQFILSEKTPVFEHEYYEWTPTKNLEQPIMLRLINSAQRCSTTAFLIEEKLKYPLILRKYHKGDYFYPVGMKGKKKLSKFFKDLKYTQLEKEQQWLLCSEDQIVWVIGQRVDARFASDKDTDNPLKITCA